MSDKPDIESTDPEPDGQESAGSIDEAGQPGDAVEQPARGALATERTPGTPPESQPAPDSDKPNYAGSAADSIDGSGPSGDAAGPVADASSEDPTMVAAVGTGGGGGETPPGQNAEDGGSAQSKAGPVRLASDDGKIEHIRLRSAPGGGGRELYDERVLAGEALQVWAAAYNRDGRFLRDIDVVWTIADHTQGQIHPVSGPSTTFSGGRVGESDVWAHDLRSGKELAKVKVKVRAGKPARIAIRDESGGKGADVTGQTVIVVVGAGRSLWAAGYDAGGNYVGDQEVHWSGTGVAARGLIVAGEHNQSVVLKPRNLGDGWITANPVGAAKRVSVAVSVTMDGRCRIRILDAPGGKGDPVGDGSLTAGSTLDLWAAGYDAAGRYFDDIEVRWTVSDLLGVPFPSAPSKICTLTGGMSGKIRATRRVLTAAGTMEELIDETNTITVTPPSTGERPQRPGWMRDSRLPREISKWTIIAWLIFVGTLLLGWPTLNSRLEERLQPVAALWVALPFMIICTLIAVLFTGSLSEPLYRYDQTRKFRKQPGRSLAVTALTLFAIGMLLAFLVVFSANSKDALIGPPGVRAQAMQALLEYNGFWHRLFKLGMTGILFLVPVVLAVSAGIMAARDYDVVARQKKQRLVYMDVDELKVQALQTASKELNLDGVPAVSRLKRTEDGGVLLTVHHRGELVKDGRHKVIEERTWDITADYAGRVTKIEPQALKLLEVS